MGHGLLESAFDALAVQIAILDRHGKIVSTNRAWQRFGSDQGFAASVDHVGWSYLDVCRTAISSGDTSVVDVLRGLSGVLDGTLAKFVIHYACPTPKRELWFRMTVTPMAGGGVVVVHDDVTRLVTAERRQNLLAHELSHRVKNTLAIVQAIASQTVRLARDPSSLRKSFLGRIAALGRVHDLLTRSAWSGAGLTDVVTDTLAPFAAGAESGIEIDGPALDIEAGAAVTLSLALHELATNALKYGALSTPGGRVRVAWSMADEPSQISLVWEERGGPPVSQPTHEGFGTRLLRSMGRDTAVVFEFKPEGLRFVMEFKAQPARLATAVPTDPSA